ncbi:MAG: hypothetical protein D8M59_13075 [Planctomycetes bacterium]|nr:hypothetical protein [Planctomycetota bacterium]NOG54937.1 hypothetical protein [Planctomycetota bacterium]
MKHAQHSQTDSRSYHRELAWGAAVSCGLLATTVLLPPGTPMAAATSLLAQEAPNEIKQPGTQPNEIQSLDHADSCIACHGMYDSAVEPSHNWAGGMMAHAGRDPIFWAAMAIAEQDVPGSGDLCLRCHTPRGWIDGHSTPTDGSFLFDSEADGVTCTICHTMTNPDNSEHVGNTHQPFVPNDGGNPAIGYYGSGMLSLWGGNEMLGPYSDVIPYHEMLASNFHRDANFCGSCHDVSNPAVGDLAHNSGTLDGADPVVRNGIPGGPIEEKAAFNNFPYQYGIVERTFSEHMSSAWPTLRVADYNALPAELQDGAIQHAYESAMLSGNNGDYVDSTPRFFTCQSCHLPPVTGQGCSFGDERTDLPLHDLTGGNYWAPDAIIWLNEQGLLQLGEPLSPLQLAAIADGKSRVFDTLNRAASLSLDGNTLRIVNLTGHKLISGYPEGRRMWLNVKWYDHGNQLIREDGAYGTLTVTLDGSDLDVETILNPNDPNTKIYHVDMGMTRTWAKQLLAGGVSPDLPLTYDHVTGDVALTLQQLADSPPDSAVETFHFVLNNTVLIDNRIPPYGLRYDDARTRNALPVPNTQYGNPGPGGTFDYWDTFTLTPPEGAESASIDLLYQPTSWEYIQFLYLANDRSNSFLKDTGRNNLDAWLNSDMALPHAIASTTWGKRPIHGNDNTPPNHVSPLSADPIKR